MDGRERRHYPRRQIALDVAFGPMAATSPPSASLKPTITVDISLGGLCLYTDVLYPIGSTLSCLISIPGRHTPLRCVGTVAWFHKVSQESHGFKVGVEFQQIAPEDLRQIQALIEAPAADVPTRSKTLLLVDDDDELALALKVRLESVGYRVLVAHDGVEALQKSRTEHPTLIVLDLMLPKLNGYEVCRLLKFDQKFKHIPVILLTARVRQEDRELGYAVGADAYITKPFHGTTLLETIEELLTKTSGVSHG